MLPIFKKIDDLIAIKEQERLLESKRFLIKTQEAIEQVATIIEYIEKNKGLFKSRGFSIREHKSALPYYGLRIGYNEKSIQLKVSSFNNEGYGVGLFINGYSHDGGNSICIENVDYYLTIGLSYLIKN